MPIPEVIQMLDRIKEIHEKKNKDYAASGKQFENFERSAELAEWFNDSRDKSFVVLIGIKLARLATLLNSGSAPNNESIDDSFDDLATYCILWASYRKSKNSIIDKIYTSIEESRKNQFTTYDKHLGELNAITPNSRSTS